MQTLHRKVQSLKRSCLHWNYILQHNSELMQKTTCTVHNAMQSWQHKSCNIQNASTSKFDVYKNNCLTSMPNPSILWNMHIIWNTNFQIIFPHVAHPRYQCMRAAQTLLMGNAAPQRCFTGFEVSLRLQGNTIMLHLQRKPKPNS